MRRRFSFPLSKIAAALRRFFHAERGVAGEDDRALLRRLFRASVAERGDAINKALVVAERLLEKRPDDPLANAYKGSLLTMIGGDAHLPWTRGRYVEASLGLLDAAFANLRTADYEPALEAETMMICAATNASLPTTFGREQLVRQQIAVLMDHPGLKFADRHCLARIMAFAATSALAPGQTARAGETLPKAGQIDSAASDTRPHGDR